MSKTYFRLLVIFAYLSLSKSDNTCSPIAPVSFPIRNVSLQDGLQARGVALSFGTPAQDLAFQVSPFVSLSCLLARFSYHERDEADSQVAVQTILLSTTMEAAPVLSTFRVTHA